MEERYAYYSRIVGAVDDAVKLIQDLPKKNCYDIDFIERNFIPALGLNNEMLHEQPPELSTHFGVGLHLWQYPNQLSRYLAWLAHNAKDIKSYMEIGCRWGGTFILTTEWLKKIGAKLECAIAVDPIEPTPFIKRYIEISQIPIVYIKGFSTSVEFINHHNTFRPEFVFIDGDHNISGVMNDHLIVRRSAKIIVHHDVASQACPGTTLFWNYVKGAEDGFEHAEFVNQYQSVNGHFLGIGVLKRKTQMLAEHASVAKTA